MPTKEDKGPWGKGVRQMMTIAEEGRVGSDKYFTLIIAKIFSFLRRYLSFLQKYSLFCDDILFFCKNILF